MTNTTNTAPLGLHGCIKAIERRANKTFPLAAVHFQRTTEERNLLTAPCRVEVVEMSGTGYTATVRRVIWRGPVAAGADAAAAAAYQKVFAQ